MIGNVAIIAADQPRARGQAESLRKQTHHAVSLFYEMGHLSGRKTRNGISYGKSAAYGRTEPEISSSHTKKVAFNQAALVVKYTPDQYKPGSDTNMAPGHPYPIGFLLFVGWSEALQHRVVLGIEGFQLRILGFSGSCQDGVCKSDAV